MSLNLHTATLAAFLIWALAHHLSKPLVRPGPVIDVVELVCGGGAPVGATSITKNTTKYLHIPDGALPKRSKNPRGAVMLNLAPDVNLPRLGVWHVTAHIGVVSHATTVAIHV